jgi:hypothetical protein
MGANGGHALKHSHWHDVMRHARSALAASQLTAGYRVHSIRTAPMAAPPRDPTPKSAARRDWSAEYAALSARDGQTALDPTDLEQLGIAAYLAGRESVSIEILTRAHTTALERGETRQAARSAFWIAFALISARELSRAAG